MKWGRWKDASLLAIGLFVASSVGAHAATLHLDTGFVGVPVSLTVGDGSAQVLLDEETLTKPADLDVEQVSSTAWSVRWSTSYALASGTFMMQFVDPFASTTDTKNGWAHTLVQARAPLGNWQTVSSTAQNGKITATLGPEEDIRLVSSETGMRAGSASWYRFKNCACAASPDYPKGTYLKVSLQSDPSKSTIVKVNDYGPDRSLFPNRAIDLDAVAFKQLSPLSAGVIQVSVEPVTASDPVVATLASAPVARSSTSCAVTLSADLAPGDTGSSVSALQTALICMGYLASGNATGYFGPVTLKALNAYQAALGFTPYPGAGPQTRHALTLGQTGN